MPTFPLAPRFEPNPALRVLYSWFFDAIQVDDGWVRDVRAMARKGSVVYVLRNLNPVDFLALDHLTKRYDLPRIRFANELPLTLLAQPGQPGLFSRIFARRRTTPSQQLRAALSEEG